jgi:hypothetical protein
MEKGKEIFSLFPFFFLVFWGWGGGGFLKKMGGGKGIENY